MEPKREFNTPEDFDLEASRELEKGFEKQMVFPGPLIGGWVNTNPGTRGIVKLTIGAPGTPTTVHLFGACTPTPCDWGTVRGVAYSTDVGSSRAVSFTALYAFPFKDTFVAGHLEGQLLILELFNHFKDNSGRFDYYGREAFRRG
jgi:hypothetical protein